MSPRARMRTWLAWTFGSSAMVRNVFSARSIRKSTSSPSRLKFSLENAYTVT